MNRNAGFTLVELLVVISVISLLSSVVLASLQNVREKARYARAEDEINLLVEAIQIASQNRGGVPLSQITGNGCSGCSCRNKQLKNIATSTSCFQDMKSTIDSIAEAAGKPYKDITERVIRDPWGSPYLIDENEQVSGGGLGTIKSAGSDGLSPGHGVGEIGRRIPRSSP